MTFGDRVVCDEASAEELQAVVADCELSPHRYRDLALAMLERRKLALLLASVPEQDETSTHSHVTPRKMTWLETSNVLIPWAAAVCMTVVAASLAFSRFGDGDRGMNPPEMASFNNTTPVDSQSPRLVRVDSSDVGPNDSLREWVSPMAQPVIPRDLKTTIRGLGWDVRERAEIYVLEDETGRQYAIPDRDFEFHFMSGR